MYGLKLPDWFSKEEYPIIDVDILDEYIHFLIFKNSFDMYLNFPF